MLRVGTIIKEPNSLSDARRIRSIVGDHDFDSKGPITVVQSRKPDLTIARAEDLALLAIPSQDENGTLFSKRIKDIDRFFSLIDKFLMELRLNGRCREDIRKTILTLASQDDFDFTAVVDGRSSPLQHALMISYEDPTIYKGKNYFPHYTDRRTLELRDQVQEFFNDRFKGLNRQSLRQQFEMSGVYERLGVSKERSAIYTQASTELTRDLLKVAQARGYPLGAPLKLDDIEGDTSLLDSTQNYSILNYLIENGASNSDELYDLSEARSFYYFKNYEKLENLIYVYAESDFSSFADVKSGDLRVTREIMDEMKALFELALMEYFKSGKDSDCDPVACLLGASQVLPEDFIYDLLQIADREGYCFTDTPPEYLNLLSILVEHTFDDDHPVFIPVKVYKFLLDKGVSPFKAERTAKIEFKCGAENPEKRMKEFLDFIRGIDFKTKGDNGEITTIDIPDDVNFCNMSVDEGDDTTAFEIMEIWFRNYLADSYIRKNWTAQEMEEYPVMMSKLQTVLGMFIESQISDGGH